MSKQLKSFHPQGYFHVYLPDPKEWFSMYPDQEISTDFREATLRWTLICMHLMSQAESVPRKGELLKDIRKLRSETAEVLYRVLGSGDRREIDDFLAGNFSPPGSLPNEPMDAMVFLADLLKSSARGLKWFEDEAQHDDFGISSDMLWDWWIGGLTQIFEEVGLNTTVRKDGLGDSPFALFVHSLQEVPPDVPKVQRHVQSVPALSQGIYRSRERTQKTLFPSVAEILNPDKGDVLRLWEGNDGLKAVRFK